MAEAVVKPGLRARAAGWARHHVPTREGIESNRYLRPVAHRILAPALWRFTRRSVPRGVALGLFTGILFPFAHMLLAALGALPLKANVPVAVGMTLLNNPLTVGPLLVSAYEIGHWVLRIDHAVPGAPITSNVKAHAGWLHWLVANGGPSTIVGLVILAVVLSATGYLAASLAWRVRIARKWRARSGR